MKPPDGPLQEKACEKRGLTAKRANYTDSRTIFAGFVYFVVKTFSVQRDPHRFYLRVQIDTMAAQFPAVA